jgi:hypothetical protein
MKMELAAIPSALAAIGVQKNGGKGKPPGGAPLRGQGSSRRAARQAGQAQEAQWRMRWVRIMHLTG